MDTTKSTSTCSSPLLDLPKELRLLIYDHIYPVLDDPRHIEILKTQPPSKALILTCKQIHHEIGNLYLQSFHHFWTTSSFLLLHDPQVANETSRNTILTSLLPHHKSINHITNLTLISTTPTASITSATLVHNKGGWRIVTSERIWLRRYRKWLFRQDPRSPTVVVPTKAAWDGYGDEAGLRRACESYGCGVPMVNQVLHVLGLELVDLSGSL